MLSSRRYFTIAVLTAALLTVAYFGRVEWKRRTFLSQQKAYFKGYDPHLDESASLSDQDRNQRHNGDTVAHAKALLANMKRKQKIGIVELSKAVPMEPLSLDFWQYYDIIYAYKRLNGSQMLACGKQQLSRPRVVFVGDSVMRNAFESLLMRLGIEEKVNQSVPHDKQQLDVSIDGVSFQFQFLKDSSLMGEILEHLTSEQMGSKRAGAVVFNSGIWDQNRNDYQFLSRYMKHIAQLALKVSSVGNETRIVWRHSTPVNQPLLRQIDSYRASYFSNVKLRLMNKVAEDLLIPADVVIADPTPLWDSAFDHHNELISSMLWKSDGYHPSPLLSDMIVDIMMNSVCGDGVQTWDRRGTEYLAAMEGEDFGWNYKFP